MGGSPQYCPSVDRTLSGEPASEEVNELRNQECGETPVDKSANEHLEKVQDE